MGGGIGYRMRKKGGGESGRIFNVNQKYNGNGDTPLHYATRRVSIYGAARTMELCRLLLENGAVIHPNMDPTRAFDEDDLPHCPLFYDVLYVGEPAIVRLFFDHDVDLLRRVVLPALLFRYANTAIEEGHGEILTILFDHGAIFAPWEGQPLLTLLRNPRKSRDNKLEICRILAELASNKKNRADGDATANYLQLVLGGSKRVLFTNDEEDAAGTTTTSRFAICEILLQAGVTPSNRTLRNAVKQQDHNVWRLFVQFGILPFRHDDNNNTHNKSHNNNNNNNNCCFHLAARQDDTALF
jgi:hypothetical protein